MSISFVQGWLDSHTQEEIDLVTSDSTVRTITRAISWFHHQLLQAETENDPEFKSAILVVIELVFYGLKYEYSMGDIDDLAMSYLDHMYSELLMEVK